MGNSEFLKGHAKEKKKLYRLLTIFFGIDLLIIGLVTIIASAVIIGHYKKYLDFADPKYLGGISFCLIVGLVVFGVGILGLYGAIQEKIGSLQAFFVLVLVLLFMDILAGSLCLAYRTKVDHAVDHSLTKGIRDYYTKSKTKDFFDWLHKEYDCCGLSGPDDWAKTNSSNAVQATPKASANTTSKPSTAQANSTGTPQTTTSFYNRVHAPPQSAQLHAGGIPLSCCKHNSGSSSCTSKAGNVYKKGCRKDFEDLIHYLLGVVGTIAFFCAIVELIGACITYVFLLGMKEEVYQTIS